MSVLAVEASAPTRIDLAGSGLDLWPLYLFHPGAVALSVAVDRRAWCRVETGPAGYRIESKDTLAKVDVRDLSEVRDPGPLSLVARILEALEAPPGLKVVTQLRVPARAGLGDVSALAVAVTAAVSRTVGGGLDPDRLWPIVRDVEVRCAGVPAGMLDAVAAIHGGIAAVHLVAGGVRVERLQTDPARVEECLLLVDSGADPPRVDPWSVFKGQIEGDPGVRAALARITAAATSLRQALISHRYADVVPLIAEEWEARKALGPGATTPEIDRIAEVAAGAGGAAKACGGGRGGLVVVWNAPERSAAVGTAIRAAGFRTLSFRLDLRGLEVE